MGFFNLHGGGAGNLTLSIERQSDPPVATQLWQVQGRGEGGYDVDEWSGVEHELSSDVDSRVIFTATVGRKEVGTIAIDDVTFTPNCVFKEDSHPTTHQPTEPPT